MTSFSSGQRYISLAEPDLGLGIVEEITGRHLTILFPLAEEERIYSSVNAPLIRCIFEAGDRLVANDGLEGTIKTIEHQGPTVCYTLFEGETVHESEISPTLGRVSPIRRLEAGQIGSSKWFNIYRELVQAFSEFQGSVANGFVGPKINLIPHQFDVANQVLSMPLPRALLADEVGLGKTIEAGLVIHQLIASQRAQRILICVPASLVNQWLVEMKRKFNLDCTLIDDEYCEEQEGENPFAQVQVALCNFDWLQNTKYIDKALNADWDMLVVDESHRLQWDSLGYQSALALSKVSQGVLLLTATPEQLGIESHFARLHLLDPVRFPNLEQFLDEEKQYGLVSSIVDTIELEGIESVMTDISSLEDEKLLAKALAVVEGTDTEEAFVDWMADRYGTGRMVYRNTRKSIEGFPVRHTEFYHLADATNLEWLISWIPSLKGEKCLIICHSAHDAQIITESINEYLGDIAGAFHEQYSLLERDQIAANFIEHDGIQILVCSEIGGEGRNFQHAQNLVLFDLPNHPDLVDQRIGRLDRIGQGSDIYIHIPLQKGSSQSRLAALYHHGFDMFAQPNPAASPIFEAYSIEIEEMLETGANAEAVIMQAQQACYQLLDEIEQGRDKLLEQHSYSNERISPLLNAIQEMDSHNHKLIQLMMNVFDNGHIDTETNGDTLILAPQENCSFSFVNSMREDKCSITFDRGLASQREDLEFISWDHPWVKGILDDLEASGHCFTATGLCRNSNLPNGHVVVESFFQLKAEGPGRLELNRFLKPTTRRYFVSEELKNLTKLNSETPFLDSYEHLSRDMAKELIQLKNPSIQAALSLSEKLAIHTTQQDVEMAVNDLLDKTKSELARYKSLEITPGSYQLEIDALTQKAKESIDLLQNARPRLQGIMIWVNYLD